MGGRHPHMADREGIFDLTSPGGAANPYHLLEENMSLKSYLATLALAAVIVSPNLEAADSSVIYKSTNKIDLIKLDKAKKAEKEGGLNHPHEFTEDQLRAILSSIHFNKKILIIKDIESRDLFRPENVEFLTPYLKEAFEKVNNEQVVVVSYFTRDTKLVIQNDRLTIMRAYVKEDGLHIKFTKLYAKLLGDRVTKGRERTATEARGMRVSLELQPGQNRIGWNPEELVFDLSYFGPSGAVVSKPAKKEKGKKGKVVKEEEKAEPVKGTKKTAAADEEATEKITSVRERLKELDQLKKDEMITEKEYRKKRAQILKEL